MATTRHGAFHPLRVTALDRLAEDAVRITLAVPRQLRGTFRHRPGQHIALRRLVDGQEIRRTYSVCTPQAPGDGPDTLSVGVRRIEGGAFSHRAVGELAVGDTLEAMAPTGRFVLEPGPGRFAAVVGGSGITPVLSMAATLLEREPRARFSLLRSDRDAASAMFLDEVADLKDRWPDRFQLVHALSREERHSGLPSGRLDHDRLTELLPALLPVDRVEGWFLCGPPGLVRDAQRALSGLGVDRARVHQEIFHLDEAAEPAARGTAGRAADGAAGHGPGAAELTATLDGRTGTWPVAEGDSLLQTVLRHRPDAPYACRGGVCGTCRAVLVGGEVRMDRNYALEPDEVAGGAILSCQARPITERVELDFDR